MAERFKAEFTPNCDVFPGLTSSTIIEIDEGDECYIVRMDINPGMVLSICFEKAICDDFEHAFYMFTYYLKNAFHIKLLDKIK